MSTPTQKHTKSRKNIRRGAIKLTSTKLVLCPKCKQPLKPHTACPNCGTYKGKQVFKVRVPKKFRGKKKETKETKTKK